jgi:hypothetical protein
VHAKTSLQEAKGIVLIHDNKLRIQTANFLIHPIWPLLGVVNWNSDENSDGVEAI